MQFLRKMALTSAASLLTLSLFGLGVSWSLYQVFGTAAPLKKDLKASGIYDSAVINALSQHQDDTGSSVTRIRTDNPQVQRIITQSFPPSFVQSQSEKTIDAVYAWLNGTQSSLQFNVDLSGAKADLANNMAAYVQQRLSQLPACTPETIPTGDVNVFTVQCLPPGFNQAAAVEQARSQVLDGGFLSKTRYTQDTPADNGKTLAQQLAGSRSAFQRIHRSIIITAVVAAVMAAVVVLLSATRRVGVRKVSIILITVGVVSGVLAWLSSFVAHQVVQHVGDNATTNTSLTSSLAKLAQLLADDVRTHWLLYAVALVAAGVGALVILKLTQPKSALELRLRKQGTAAGMPAAAAGATIQKTGRPLVSTDRQTQAEHAAHIKQLNKEPRLTVDGMPAEDTGDNHVQRP